MAINQSQADLGALCPNKIKYMIPFHERIKVVLAALSTTPYKFASEHDGFNKATMFNMLNPDKRPSFEILERMCIVQPRISAEYLLRGEGEPLRDQQLATALTTVEELKHFKEEIVESLDKRIEEWVARTCYLSLMN